MKLECWRSCTWFPLFVFAIIAILITACRNHKPTDSDLDDDSDYDPDDDDPATWFDDQDDDGVKGQDIIEPDDEDYSDIIRVDSNRVHAYSTFYEPRDPD